MNAKITYASGESLTPSDKEVAPFLEAAMTTEQFESYFNGIRLLMTNEGLFSCDPNWEPDLFICESFSSGRVYGDDGYWVRFGETDSLVIPDQLVDKYYGINHYDQMPLRGWLHENGFNVASGVMTLNIFLYALKTPESIKHEDSPNEY